MSATFQPCSEDHTYSRNVPDSRTVQSPVDFRSRRTLSQGRAASLRRTGRTSVDASQSVYAFVSFW
jgi:hypothetical protein